uniref:Small ribosomal subunit protein uS3c n=1 Tax=Geranium phaeum TaxID=379952 RepID=A0A165TWM4_9ROSI|nr:ribosomal protein S3 [Geranium phaeum]
MGQKINPLGFRLGTTQNHHSIWFEKPKKYCESLQEDQKIRDRIKNYIDNHRVCSYTKRILDIDIETDYISRIQIEKVRDFVQVIIYMGFPMFLIKGKPHKLNELKVDVEKVLHCGNRNLTISIRKIGNPCGDPNILTAILTQQLKKRVSFRKAMKKTIEVAEKMGSAKGIKVQLAGRIDGREMACVEWLRKGRVSLQTIRTKIDFCSTTVRTIHGVLGIKIWIFANGES